MAQHLDTYTPTGAVYCQYGLDVIDRNNQGAKRCNQIATIGLWIHDRGLNLCADHHEHAIRVLDGIEHLANRLADGTQLIGTYPNAEHRGDRVWPPDAELDR